MKILIIEDEPSLLEITRNFLQKEKYIVEEATNYKDALQKISDYDYDCILLDIMLPDGDGLSLLHELKQIRKQSNIIITSAKDSIDDKVKGLELGADDYLAKPFHLAELNARIKSIIRRDKFQGEIHVEIGNVKLVPAKNEVYVNNKQIELNRKEYDILNYFMSRPNHVVDKMVLAESVWGDHIDQADNFDFLYAQVKNLRKKMSEAGSNIEIKAVYGMGYKLIVEA